MQVFIALRGQAEAQRHGVSVAIFCGRLTLDLSMAVSDWLRLSLAGLLQ